MPYRVRTETNFTDQYDAVVVVMSPRLTTHPQLAPILESMYAAKEVDQNLGRVPVATYVDLPSKLLILSPTRETLVRDIHDVRSIAEAADIGITRALSAGASAPLLVLPEHRWFPQCPLASVLGALSALYVPLQLREDIPSRMRKVEYVGVWTPKPGQAVDVQLAEILEIGRSVTRDIGASDPERMCPAMVQAYVEDLFTDTVIGLKVISDPYVLAKDYPLFSAVDRCSRQVERYEGRILYLTYEPPGPVRQTLFLVGKGVTYDMGGADIKTGGAMVGMSRDKSGAAAVAGFMKVLSILQPEGIRVVGAMPVVRNNIGPQCYVADEIITARSRKRVLIGNTDAEGRLILADVLCHMKEMAVDAVNPHLVTIATLTGHAKSVVGPGYTIVMDNGPAREQMTAQQLIMYGEQLGDMFEISTIRREDYKDLKGRGQGIDVLQVPSRAVRSSRNHQSAAAFLIIASGLDQHGLDSTLPLKYTHLDIAPSAGEPPDEGTGCPLLGLYALFIQEH